VIFCDPGTVTLHKGVTAVRVVDAVHPVEMVDPETATKVSSPLAKLTAIMKMLVECANEHRREEKQRYDEHICFECGLPGHVEVDCVFNTHIQEWWKVNKLQLQQLSL
jgi:hypothetical protein